ncbi:MAG TPA: GNAT family N-acetyltransferase [Candidatus Elarobacter sp.]|nr:GNAT family N-acetyltransferase [Candidatus Elarobacter sp.]HEV2738073.1 GNAT family N-acetyltransferase [Candidatus Elarobacter sp.]
MSGEIVTERLVLRELRPDDAEAMFAYRSDPAIMRYQGWDPESLADVREFIADNADYRAFAPGSWRQFAITLRAAGELLGDCGVHVPEDKPEQAEFGITLATPSKDADTHRKPFARCCTWSSTRSASTARSRRSIRATRRRSRCSSAPAFARKRTTWRACG